MSRCLPQKALVVTVRIRGHQGPCEDARNLVRSEADGSFFRNFVAQSRAPDHLVEAERDKARRFGAEAEEISARLDALG